MKSRNFSSTVCLVIALSLSGCAIVLGYGDEPTQQEGSSTSGGTGGIGGKAGSSGAEAGGGVTGGNGGSASISSTGGMAGAGGGMPQCGPNNPCNDGNPCTDDICNTGTCEFTALDGVPTPGYIDTAGDCNTRTCVTGVDTLVANDQDVPSDNNECTTDACVNSGPVHTPVSIGTQCNGATGMACDASAQCTCPGTIGQLCDGVCKDLAIDSENCGACGQTCLPDATGINTCSSGNCKSRSWADWPMTNPPIGNLPNAYFYTVNVAKDLVIDGVTKLMWQRSVSSYTYTWNQAKTYCADLVHGGYDDWRLPTRIELVSLVEFTSSNPAIDWTSFPNTPSVPFWTSSPWAPSASYAWVVRFDSGSTDFLTISNTLRVRCVR